MRALVSCALLSLVGCARPELGELDARLAAVEAEADDRGQAAAAERAEAIARLDMLERRVKAIEEYLVRNREVTDDLGRMLDALEAQLEGVRDGLGVVDTGRFHKGEVAPRGLSELEIRQHASAQGDPQRGRFSLRQALAGDPVLADRSRGTLVATFDTSHGRFECRLFEDETPRTVANFVGLARGRRPWHEAKSDRWVRRPLYDGTAFHRVIEAFMIQGGDPEGTGRGDIGYVIEDEVVPGFRHLPGTLSMANRGENTASSQFFVMVSSQPHLDGKHTIFGECDTTVPLAIAKVKVDPALMHRPVDPVVIHTIEISRVPAR